MSCDTTCPEKCAHFSDAACLREGSAWADVGCFGGESGIRTHGKVSPTLVFKTRAFSRSAISPVQLRSVAVASFSCFCIHFASLCMVEDSENPFKFNCLRLKQSLSRPLD